MDSERTNTRSAKQWWTLCAIVGGLLLGLFYSSDSEAAQVSETLDIASENGDRVLDEVAGSEPGGLERTAETSAEQAEEIPFSTIPQSGPLAGLDPSSFIVQDGHAISQLRGGGRARLTIDPGLQAHIEGKLEQYEVPFGALVAMDPRDGRVLAYVSHSSANPEAGDLARDTTPPTASVFKVITASALVDAGIGGDRRVCYAGGSSRLLARHLEDRDSDRQCATLSEAMGRSINAVFAKLADRHLDGATIERYASAFGFGHALPFDLPTRPSPMEVPSDRLERARTAAGFWHMHMSPLHGALIASTIANGGMMPRAGIVERAVNGRGEETHRFEAQDYRQVIPRRTARAVGEMMEMTVHGGGTARRAFRDPAGRPFIPNVRIAGKTGTLSSERPYRGYTWFVGYAPADDPQIAVAALVVNTPQWRIKAPYLAREALRYHLNPRN